MVLALCSVSLVLIVCVPSHLATFALKYFAGSALDSRVEVRVRFLPPVITIKNIGIEGVALSHTGHWMFRWMLPFTQLARTAIAAFTEAPSMESRSTTAMAPRAAAAAAR